VSASPDSRRRIEGPASPARLNFCEAVERLRRECGLFPGALVAPSKIEAGEQEEILRGERSLGVDAIYLLAGALGVAPEVLLEGVEWHPPIGHGSGWTITGGGQDG